MYFINANAVPATCLDKVTDWMAAGDETDIKTAIAEFEVAAAVIDSLGMVAVAQCRVANCPVQCKIFHAMTPEGLVYPTAFADEDDDTGLTNCVR